MILPDADSSPRWEARDRPALEAGFAAAGLASDIQNAQNDPERFAEIGVGQLAAGCSTMLLVDVDGAGAKVAARAKTAGVPVIAYDRPIAGADYYVAFDSFDIGALQAESIIDGLVAAGKDPKTAAVVFMGGDPGDGNSKLLRDGAMSVFSVYGIRPIAEPEGTWDADETAREFAEVLDALDGPIDAVWAANDTKAGAVIGVLDERGLRMPVSGQDASVEGLRNVLLGKQSATVYKPATAEAGAAISVILSILAGRQPDVSGILDGTPYSAVVAKRIDPETVGTVVDAGAAPLAEVCGGDTARACLRYRVGGGVAHGAGFETALRASSTNG